MACDKGLAQILRDDLVGESISEKRMFGGLAFLLAGHMVCGVHKGGAMFRVGLPNDTDARSIAGVSPMAFTGKTMAGFVDCDDDCTADDARRGALMTMALAFVRTLPPK